jgi:hypothetical protein
VFVAFAKYSAPLAAAMLIAGSAQATVIITSGATATSTKTTILSTITANVAVGKVTGTTPGAYDSDHSLANINSNLTLSGNFIASGNNKLNAGAVTYRAVSNGTNYGTGSVSMINASTVLGNSLFGILSSTVLGLSADVIGSTTTVSGASGSLVGTGGSTLTNLAFTGSAFHGLNLDASAYVSPAANTILLSLAGLKVTLNEQIATGNGTTALAYQTNAIHITLDDYILNGSLLTGDIILGHSEASIAGFVPTVTGPVPELATWAMMIAGFGLIGTALRRHRPARMVGSQGV